MDRWLRVDDPLCSTSKSARAGAVSLRVKSDFLAERRQLTVMFCDLVGSTALAARLGWFRYHIESEDSPAAACALTCRPGGDGSSSRVGPAEAVLRMKQ